MKRLGLFLIALLTIIGLVSCAQGPYRENDAMAKEKGFNYRIDYRMYEITPQMAKEKLSFDMIQSKGKEMHSYVFYANNYKVQNNELKIAGNHIRAYLDEDSSVSDIDGSLVINDNETTDCLVSLRINKWTIDESWNTDGAIKEIHYYIGLYRIRRI